MYATRHTLVCRLQFFFFTLNVYQPTRPVFTVDLNYRAYLSLVAWAPQLWRDVAADRGFLWDRLPCMVSDIRNILYNQLGMRDERFSEIDRSKWLRNGFCFGDSVTPRDINIRYPKPCEMRKKIVDLYRRVSLVFKQYVILSHLYSC
jgi:hypothetical protein